MQGYFLSAKPGDAKTQGLPRASTVRCMSDWSVPYASTKPASTSKTSTLALIPARASRMATTALWAAQPAWNGLVIVPKLHRRPLAIDPARSEEHTSELQSLMRISYAVFCLQKKKN